MLFDGNHSSRYSETVLVDWYSCCMSEDDKFNFVLSANKIALQQERKYSKSFVYVINSKDPITDSLETSHGMMVVADLLLLYCSIYVYCFLL